MNYRHLLILSLMGLCLQTYGVDTPTSQSLQKELTKLETFLKEEKTDFQKRKVRKGALSNELDTINSEQNRVRETISEIEMSSLELTMALENLAIQVENHRRQEFLERERLETLLKVIYKVDRDGIFRFLLSAEGMSGISSRLRVLVRALRSRTTLTKNLIERSKRLRQSESKIAKARLESKALLAELEKQEELLSILLQKKSKILASIEKKQNNYRKAKKQFAEVSKKLAEVFKKIGKDVNRNQSEESKISTAKLLKLKEFVAPLDQGKVIKKFGKTIHKKFRTVLYHNGIEVEAKHKSPVKAVLAGKIEYKGWLKGLGNVLIVHHGDNLFSLNAHLYKSLFEEGTEVDQGETIALVGDTGASSTPSLYFELRHSGKALDPLKQFAIEEEQNLM